MTTDEPDRKRLSLNMPIAEYRDLVELAEWWRSATVHAAIARSITVGRRIHAAENPDVRWAHLPPEDRPRASYWAQHTPLPDGTEHVVRLEIL